MESLMLVRCRGAHTQRVTLGDESVEHAKPYTCVKMSYTLIIALCLYLQLTVVQWWPVPGKRLPSSSTTTTMRCQWTCCVGGWLTWPRCTHSGHTSDRWDAVSVPHAFNTLPTFVAAPFLLPGTI